MRVARSVAELSQAGEGRGGASIRNLARSAAIALLLVPLAHAAAPDAIVVLIGRDRREITPVNRGSAELVRLSALLPLFGISTSSDRQSVTLTRGGREVVLYESKRLASVGGDLRLLSAPVLHEGGAWLVPVDALPRLLGPLLDTRVELRSERRVLLVGDVPVPRISLDSFVSGDSVRVVIAASQTVPFRVNQEAQQVTIAIPRDVVDVAFQPQRLTGGIVDSIRFEGGRENVFSVALGRRFRQVQTAEEPGPPARLVLEFQAAPLAAAPSAAAAPPAAPRPQATPDAGEPVRTVVIDPGHGGSEVGAEGPAGTLEKDVTLAIARRLRSALANQGFQVFLTRDRDQEVALDDRTALANNYKADIFISIHANASRSSGARGSEVYFLSYQSSDEESRRVALNEGAALPREASGQGSSDLAFILWDMAQAEHLEESSALATRIQEELASVTGSQGRGIKQAPFRVLVGAAMPAVLVEVAFISNAAEEKLLVSDAYQGKIASAVARGVTRYRRQLQQRAGYAPGGVSGDSGRQ